MREVTGYEDKHGRPILEGDIVRSHAGEIHWWKRSVRAGLPLERVYRHLFNPQLYLLAYANLYGNAGALTPGTTEETVDGMSLAKIATLIADLRCHSRNASGRCCAC